MTNQNKLNKLCNIRTDLGDDASHISTINSAIQAAADSFCDLLVYSGSSSVKAGIEDLKEPVQGNDSNIINAKSYCQYEINRVSAEMKAENQ